MERPVRMESRERTNGLMTIEELRARIDRIDSGIVRLYEERMEAARLIGRYKREHNLPVTDPEREEQLLSRVSRETGAENREGIRELFRLLMAHSRARQETDGKAGERG